MDCHRVQQQLQALVDGELDAADTTLARRHVRACPECADEVGSLEALLRELGAARDVEPPAGLATNIADAVWERAAAPPRRARMAPIGWFWVGAATAAAAAFLLFVAWRASHPSSTPPPPGGHSPIVRSQEIVAPSESAEASPEEAPRFDAIAGVDAGDSGEIGSDLAPREIEPTASASPEPEPPRPIDTSKPSWTASAVVRPRVEPLASTCASAPDIERTAISLVVHDDGSVEVEMRGSAAERLPVLLALLGDRDRRVQTVAQQELWRISHELVSTGVLPPRSLETLASTAAPRPNVIDRLCGRTPEAPVASASERWTSWWERHRDAIVAMPDESNSMRGGF